MGNLQLDIVQPASTPHGHSRKHPKLKCHNHGKMGHCQYKPRSHINGSTHERSLLFTVLLPPIYFAPLCHWDYYYHSLYHYHRLFHFSMPLRSISCIVDSQVLILLPYNRTSDTSDIRNCRQDWRKICTCPDISVSKKKKCVMRRQSSPDTTITTAPIRLRNLSRSDENLVRK